MSKNRKRYPRVVVITQAPPSGRRKQVGAGVSQPRPSIHCVAVGRSSKERSDSDTAVTPGTEALVFERFVAHLQARDPDLLCLVDTLYLRYEPVAWASALGIDLDVLNEMLQRFTLQQQAFFRCLSLM